MNAQMLLDLQAFQGVGKVVFVPSKILNRIFVDLGVPKERSYSLLESDRGGCLDSRDVGLEHEDRKAAWLDAQSCLAGCSRQGGKELG
jgi:hypothetical protein